MSDIFDGDHFGSTESADTSQVLDPNESVPTLAVVHTPTKRLSLGIALASISSAIAIVGGFGISIVGYLVAMAAIMSAFSFRVLDDRMRSQERRFSPRQWTTKVVNLIAGISFLTIVAHASRIGWELSRRLGVLLLVVGLAGISQLVSAQTASAQDDVQRSAAAVYQRFLSCTAEGRPGLVQILVDESESLQRTDPQDKRVEALQSTIQSLDVARRNSGEALHIEVLLAGFGVDWALRNDWVTLGNSTIAPLLESARGYADLDSEIDTDYFLALDGARAAFEDRADEMISTSGNDPCQILFWITDGLYDVEDRTSALRIKLGGDSKVYAPELDMTVVGAGDHAVNLGTALLCEQGGIADQLRSSGTKNIAVTLTNESLTAGDYDLILRTVTGQSPSGSCGVEQADGAVLQGDDPSGLSVDLDPLSVQYPYSFNIDDLTAAFTLDVLSTDGPVSSEAVDLVHPSGATLELTKPAGSDIIIATGTLEQTAVTWTWYSASRVFVETDIAQGSSAGEWRLDFAGNSTPIVKLLTFAGYSLDLGEVTTIRPGEPGTVEVVLVGDDGVPLGPSALERVRVEGTLSDMATGDLVPFDLVSNGSGQIRGTVSLPADSEVTALELTATVGPIDADSALVVVERIFPIPVASPPGFPSIGAVDAANLAGTGSVDVTVDLIGDPEFAGCVEFAGAILRRSPDDATVQFGNRPKRGSCIDLVAGESKQVVISVQVDDQGRGDVAGDINFVLHSAASDRTHNRSVPFQFKIIPKVKAAAAASIAAMLIFLGLLLPLSLMLLIKIRNARYMRASNLRAAEFEIRIDRAEVVDRGEDSFNDLGENWLDPNLEGPPLVDGWAFGRRIGLNPFGSAQATVESSQSKLVVGSHGYIAGSRGNGKTPVGFISFGLRRTWAVAVDHVNWEENEGGDPNLDKDPVSADGRLIAFITDRDELKLVLEEIDMAVPAAFDTVQWADLEQPVEPTLEAPDMSITDPGVGDDTSPLVPEDDDPWAL